MPSKYAYLALLSLCLSAFARAQAAENHRVLVLDIGRWPNGREGSDHHRLLVVEVESGKVLAQAEIGFDTSLAMSPTGDLIAAISQYRGAGGSDSRLEFFRTTDLKRRETGQFPSSVPRLHYQLGAASDSRLSPGGQEVIVQGIGSFAGPAHLAETLLKSVTRESDAAGTFKLSRKPVRVPRSYGIGFLRVADWPRVHIWNGNLGLLEVLDFESGNVLSRLRIGNEPALDNLDPLELERANTSLIFSVRNRGVMVSDGGRYAFYVQQHPSSPQEPIGPIKKIDLTANPPKVVLQTEKPQPNLYAYQAVASEAAGALFTVQADVGPPGPNGSVVTPTCRIKVFSMKDLKPQREMEFSQKFDVLKVSRDGKYLYALNGDQAKLAVIDIATGNEIKVLDKVGSYPHILIALPETKADK